MLGYVRTREHAASGDSLPGQVIWQVLIKCDCAPESLQCFGCARKHSKTPRSGFDLSALTAGECHPLGQSSATEKGTYIGNRPRCYENDLRIRARSRDCARVTRSSGPKCFGMGPA